MKTSVLAMVLACVLAAGAQENQTQTQPAHPAGGEQQSSAPTIKDPAEYNAYVGAVQQQDPNAKVSALEAFLTQYPNSVMKISALELLMGTYQQTGNSAKMVDAAKRLVTADPNNLRALALLTYISRQNVATNQNLQQNLADLQTYCAKGLDAVKANQKPGTMAEADFEKLKKQTSIIFNGGCGFAALQNKDYAHAETYLRAAVDEEPKDLQNVYPLAMSYLTATPPDSLNGLFYIARAANLATGAAKTQIQGYGQKVYKNYHGSDEGWTDLLAMASTQTSPPPDLDQKITKYVPPTPAQQAHDLVKDKTPDQVKQLSFGEWELVLSAGAQEDQDKVWNVIKNVPLQMEGNVLEVTSETEIHIAASQDDIDQNRPDITLKMTGPIPKRLMPKVGDVLDFEGTPVSYTPTPFMMMMEEGKLLKKPGSQAAPKKPASKRRSTTRKPS